MWDVIQLKAPLQNEEAGSEVETFSVQLLACKQGVEMGSFL